MTTQTTATVINGQLELDQPLDLPDGTRVSVPMTTQTSATVVNGALELDHPLDLPDRSRVRVAVEPVEDWRTRLEDGLKAWLKVCEEYPIHAGGRRYTRDELHERR